MKKNYVALLVHDRFDNLKRWLHCWHNCEKHDFELFVIHNTDVDMPEYHSLCVEYGINYIKRQNVGFDSAPFQDICLERLGGIDNNWEKLIWVTDDWIPMSKNFVKMYVNHFVELEVGVVCTEMSDVVKTHIRTSGFLISKTASRNLIWDVPQIVDKDQCYDFEHRSPNALYEQILRMGLRVELVSQLHESPIWDSGHNAHMNRWAEHENVFYPKNKVAIICPIYKSYPQIISSMVTQTYTNWELYLVHDGESDDFLKKYVSIVNDDRIKFMETKERGGQYGHPIRQELLLNLKHSDCEYILITNGDNYHTPNCLEKLVNGFDSDSVATFCESMVHSYFGWKSMDCHLALGHLDCACVMVRKDIACNTGWNDIVNHSSDWTYFDDIAKVHGWDRFKKVEGCLLIHN